MPCIHGIDEVNCPICRISKFTVPKSSIPKKQENETNFLINSSFINNYSSNKEVYKKEIINKPNVLLPNLINPLPKPIIINQIPSFANKGLLEQLDKQGLANLDTYGITKKIPMKKGELQFR